MRQLVCLLPELVSCCFDQAGTSPPTAADALFSRESPIRAVAEGCCVDATALAGFQRLCSGHILAHPDGMDVALQVVEEVLLQVAGGDRQDGAPRSLPDDISYAQVGHYLDFLR
jgi:hypothetical protein